jgi:hypothetical protein
MGVNSCDQLNWVGSLGPLSDKLLDVPAPCVLERGCLYSFYI